MKHPGIIQGGPAYDSDSVPGTVRRAKLDYAVSDSIGFCGRNLPVLFRKA